MCICEHPVRYPQHSGAKATGLCNFVDGATVWLYVCMYVYSGFIVVLRPFTAYVTTRPTMTTTNMYTNT